MKTVGEYEIISHVADGGMATLYLARHPELSEPVAVKLLHPRFSDDWKATRLFIDEALISIRVRHPNVARVDELGEEDGRYFLAMEYVHGVSLADLMATITRRGRNLPIGIAAYIARCTAAGLHAAHETKSEVGEPLHVVHRDVSPQNILIDHRGEVKLVDFGIVKAEGRVDRSKRGEVLGKYRYMAPEQFDGGALDRRVDIFSLGLVLWEMLTGERVHGKLADKELLEAVQSPTLDPPSSRRQSVPGALDGLVMVCTNADREGRVKTAAEVSEALEPQVGEDAKAELRDMIRELFAPRLLERVQTLPSAMREPLDTGALEAIVSATPKPPITQEERAERRREVQPTQAAPADKAPSPLSWLPLAIGLILLTAFVIGLVALLE